MDPFPEAHRDIHTFTRRAGRLPEQREGDPVDFRPLLHRDGSVLSAVTLQVRAFSCAVLLASPFNLRKVKREQCMLA